MAFDEINEATFREASEADLVASKLVRENLENFRSRLGRPKLAVREIPAYLLADVALPGYHMPVKGEAAG